MSLRISTGAEHKALSDVVKYEVNPSFTRSSKTLLAGSGAIRSLLLGTIVAVGGLSAAVAAGGGNTGDGTVTGLAVNAEAEEGEYVLECIEAVANGGVFAVVDPRGDRQENATVGTTYAAAALGFTINDGAADFVEGDSFTITVSRVAGEKVEALSLTEADGAEDPIGICLADTTAADGADGSILVLERGPAIVEQSALVYPSGASAGQIAEINAKLLQRGIRVEQGL